MVGSVEGRDWNQKLLDDLDEGVDSIMVDLGDLAIAGIYKGLMRNTVGEWCIEVSCRNANSVWVETIPTKQISKLRRSPRKK